MILSNSKQFKEKNVLNTIDSWYFLMYTICRYRRYLFIYSKGGNYMNESKKVILTCSVCLSRNYSTNKNTNSKQRIELMKYCPKCNKHTLHKETK